MSRLIASSLKICKIDFSWLAQDVANLMVSDLTKALRGYSAGSYVGVVILSFLQEMSCISSSSILGAIACPPELLYGIANDEHQVHLVHYGADKLCVWHPETAQLHALGCTFTCVHGNVGLYPKFFGQFEHDYRHWMDLPLTEGELDLAQLLYIHPAAATEQERDAAPLRLISWLTFSLPWDLQNCIDELMDLYTGPIRPTQEKLMTVASRTLKNCPESSCHTTPSGTTLSKRWESGMNSGSLLGCSACSPISSRESHCPDSFTFLIWCCHSLCPCTPDGMMRPNPSCVVTCSGWKGMIEKMWMLMSPALCSTCSRPGRTPS